MAAIRLILVFAIAFSLATLPGPLSDNLTLPAVSVVRADRPFVQPWYPAGPAMDTLQVSIFLSQAPELNAISQAPSPIDFSDAPLVPPVISPICASPAYFCTSLVVDHGYSELEFNLANNFWGINMNFGNDPSGLLLRQGIAHLINKTSFVANQLDIAGLSTAIDNPVPAGSSFAGQTLATPNPCSWDLNFTETGSNCTTGAPGGTAYNCSVGAKCPIGTVTPGTSFPWQPAIGSADFCAAATHFKTAFNRVIPGGGVTLNANCVLLPPGLTTPDTAGTVWQSKVPGWTSVSLFSRVDDHPRLQLGQSIAQELCGLFTGVLITGCGNAIGGIPLIVFEFEEIITTFPGFTTDPTRLQPTWHIYTAGFDSVFPFDSSIYSGYNSRFVDSYCTTYPACPRGTGGTPNPNQPLAQANGGPCSNAAVPTFGPANYMYLCNPTYDNASSQMEFAPSLSAAFTSATNAMNLFGQGAFTIPIWTGNHEFVYLSNWQRAINADGAGTPNFFTWLNAWTSTPATGTVGCPTSQPICIRQGFYETTRRLNPYVAVTPHDFFMLRNIYDSLSINNPTSNGQSIEWMVNNPNGPVIINCTIGAGGVSTCPGASNPASNPIPPFTTKVIRMDLRSDLFWQDANLHPTSGFVSAYDVKFTYTTMLTNGAFQSSSLAPMQCTQPNCVDGIQVTTPREFEIRVKQLGVFTLSEIGSLTILPGRLWSTCGVAQWDSGMNAAAVPEICMVLDAAKATPSFDPLAAGILIGSGAWVCTNSNGFTPQGFSSPPAIGTGCAHDASGLPFNHQNPPVGGNYILQRFGYGTGAPAASPPNRIYFRSSSSAARWIWSVNTGDPTHDSANLGIVMRCQSAPLANLDGIPDPSLGYPNGCAHWQQGIGGGHTVVGPFQIGMVRFVFMYKWTPTINGQGSDWTATYGTPPDGIATFPPVLYEGSFFQAGVTYRPTLNPAVIAGCTNPFDPTSPTSGGYDC